MIKPLSTTGIGSLPHRDPVEACRLVLKSFDIPFWPQFPNISFTEFMVPQYTEGMPFCRVDPAKQAVWVEKTAADDLERFYEGWTEKSRIAISADYARGLHAFVNLLHTRLSCVKGQTTGPLTFTLGLKDQTGKAIFFDEELREICLMLLKAKTRWQIDILKDHAEEVIIFIDEPILSALGSSAYLAVGEEETLRLLRELIGAIHAEGALAGIHCCGNADWSLVIRSGADIINFDAFDYLEPFALYPNELRDFLGRGGFLAWGVVPTSDAIRDATPGSVRETFEKGVERLSAGVPASLLLSRVLITPSCGLGSRTVQEALKAVQLLMGLREVLT
jgi:methionine synthase II (cobalamin-independent)